MQLQPMTSEDQSSMGRTVTAFPGTNAAARNRRTDVYSMIGRNFLDDLRVDVESLIPVESPFSPSGTRLIPDFSTLHSIFLRAPTFRVPVPLGKHADSKPLNAIVSSGTENDLDVKTIKIGLLLRRGMFCSMTALIARRYQ